MRQAGRPANPARRHFLKSSSAAGLSCFTAMKTAAAPATRLTLTAATVPDPDGHHPALRLKGDWLIRLPDRLDARQAMAIGTAGYTAMLAALALEHGGVRAGEGEVLVTGAAGGVGSLEHLADGVTQGRADAVLAASIFHFGEYTIGQAKRHMASSGLRVRLD